MILKQDKDKVFRIDWEASGTEDGNTGSTFYSSIYSNKQTISKKGRKKYMKAYKEAATIRLLQGRINESNH